MALNDSFQQLKNLDLAELDFESVGVWPLPVKAFLLIVAFCLVLTGGYYFYIKDLGAELTSAQDQEEKLKVTFEKKHSKLPIFRFTVSKWRMWRSCLVRFSLNCPVIRKYRGCWKILLSWVMALA